MNQNIRFKHLHEHPGIRERISSDLQEMAKVLSIDEASVTVDRVREGSRAIRIRTRLAIPGPDLMALATDYTLTAAWNKVKKSLGRQLSDRRMKQGSLHRPQPRKMMPGFSHG